MTKHKKLSARILSMALSVAMVCTMMPSTVFAAEGDVPLGASSITECHPAHDEDCGYLEAVEGVACSHLNEDGTYSCAPALDSGDVSGNAATPSDAEKEYVCDHADDCGYAEAIKGTPCTHECEICKVLDSGKQQPTCDCIVKCIEADGENGDEAVINAACPVCGTENADLEQCNGKAPDFPMLLSSEYAVWGNDTENFYASIKAAMDANDYDLTINEDLIESATITPTQSLSINLNGHKLTNGGSNAFFDLTTASVQISDQAMGGNASGIDINGQDLYTAGDANTIEFVLGTSANPITISNSQNSGGKIGAIDINQVNSIPSYVKIASNATLEIDADKSMTVGFKANLINEGTITNLGTFTLQGGCTLSNTGTLNNGDSTGGTLNIQNAVITGNVTNNHSSSVINVTGGTITELDNNNKSGKIVVTGGTIQSITNSGGSGTGTVVNGSDAALELYTVTIGSPTTVNNTWVSKLSFTEALGYDYGCSGVNTDSNGKIYVWVPAAKTAANAVVSSKTYSGTITNNAATLIEVSPTVSVATQTGTLTYGNTGSATFTVATSNFATAPVPTDYTLAWFSDSAGNTGTAAPNLTVTKTSASVLTIAPGTANVGTYYFKLTATKGSETATSGVVTVTVGKADATNEMKTVAATVSKNGATGAIATLPTKPAAATYGTITYGGTITCSNATVNGDTLTYTAPASAVGATGTITIPVTTATNYNDYDIVVTITSTDKKAATITAAVADKTYNGVAVTQPTPTAVEKDTATPVTLTYTYKWQKSNGSGGYTDISGNTAPKDAGSYKLVIEGSSDTHAGTTEIAFTISKATVTITADNKSAYVGDAKPTLTYTATGLASGDTLATVPTLTYESEPDMSKAGSVKIKASGAVVPNTDNYGSAITYVDGTLTISNKSSGGGGGGGGGSSSGGSSTTPPTKTEPVSGTSNTTATVDKNGNATTTVTDKNIADAVKAAKDAASKKGVNAGEVTAVINVTAPANSNPNTVTVNLPKTVQQQVINNKIGNVAIVIDKPDISIGMNLATITEMNKQANADIQLSATRTDATKLSTEAKNAIGNRPAFDLKATYNSGAKSITSFGSGSVSVAIPYTLQKGEVAGGLYAVYIDSNGKANYITGSSYDANTKMLRFATNHFSVYGIGYKAPVGFTDIAGHWAKADIEFVANRGLMSGTSNTTFAPNGSMTRGMFVTALGRLAGVDVNSYKTSKFTDVKADAYYAPYVNWAAEKGITNGTTATTFSPDSTVTRQEMAVFMSNYAKAIGYKVPETREAVTFADNGSIGSWAAAAVKQMQMAGVLNGKNGNKFDPTSTATRAEVAAVLHRYVELVIDRSTAQGLDTNDSGSAMMYENGKVVKSASRTVNSTTYNFNANGEAALLPADNKKTGTYTVQKGDSFWLIAKKVGCTMAELEQLNGKSRNDFIYAGQTLKVPQK